MYGPSEGHKRSQEQNTFCICSNGLVVVKFTLFHWTDCNSIGMLINTNTAQVFIDLNSMECLCMPFYICKIKQY